MPGGNNAIDDDDDDLAKLMPNMAKLIQFGESSSLESKGSTSMSFSGNSVKGDVERQTPKPGRQRRRESIFREVANKFLRRGAIEKRASKPSALATLSSNCRVGNPSAVIRKNAHALEKENVRPKSPTLVKQGARSTLQQNLATGNVSQKVSKKSRKTRSRSEGSNYFSVNSKIQRTAKPNNISLSEQMAQPAATVSLPKMSRKRQGSEPDSRLAENNERGKARLYMTTMPLNLSELKEEFAEIDEEALEEEEVSVARMTRRAPVMASQILSHHTDVILQNIVENRKDLSRCEKEKVESDTVNAKIEEAALPIHSHEQEGAGTCKSGSVSRKTLDPVQELQVYAATGKGNDAVLSTGLDRNAETSALKQPGKQLSPPDNHDLDGGNQGHIDKNQNEENPPCIEQASASPLLKGLEDKASVDANGRTADSTTASVLETSRKDTRGSALFELTKAEASCNHKRENSPTNANVDQLEESKGDCPDEAAAHLEESVPRLSSTFKDVQISVSKAHLPEQEDAPDIPLQGGTFSAQEKSAAPPHLHYCRRGRINGMNQRRLTFESSSGSKQKTMAKAMDRDNSIVSVSTVEFKGKTNSAASGEMGNDPYSLSPQDCRATECLKIRGLGKRTWANLGAPIDGGREWKEGRRVSTRIKSRPLDWWRGERMLYGRVHSTLCTLIGIKTTSPDPVWPRPKPQRGDYTLSNFHVDSFVDDSHCELLRLAAQ